VARPDGDAFATQAVIGRRIVLPRTILGAMILVLLTMRALLLAASGSGSFPIAGVPASGTVYDITSPPDGGWTFQGNPMALASGGYTYTGFVDGSGNIKVNVSQTGVSVSTVTLHAALEADDHDNPTLYVRPDGKLHAFYSKHVGTNIYERISNSTLASDPDLSDGFASENSLSSTFGSTGSTYPSSLYLSNVDGAGDYVFLFWREAAAGVPTQEWWYNAHDFSTTWGGTTHLHQQTYSKVDTDGVGRIDVFSSLHPDDGSTHIYHVYRESAAWHESDGTSIAASLPFADSDMTTVYTASGSDIVWIADGVTNSGNPVALFYRWPSDDTSDVRIMWSRWTGAAWDTHEVTAAGGYVPSSVEYPVGTFQDHYPGGAALDHADPNVVYVSKEVSGQFEMFRYVTADNGATWTGTQLTTASANKQMRPVSVRNPADVEAVWMDASDYTNYVTYSSGIKGYAP